jgi:hypothetical protein
MIFFDLIKTEPGSSSFSLEKSYFEYVRNAGSENLLVLHKYIMETFGLRVVYFLVMLMAGTPGMCKMRRKTLPGTQKRP